jgi:GNAT superfamily N-acetyltransferase
MNVVLTREDFDGDVARPLLVALDAELDERYTGEGIDPPEHAPVDYAPPRGTFLVAWRDGVPVGCGALKPGPFARTGEVKRMYVAPEARGRRIAERVLSALVEAARDLGHTRLVLETGIEQPEALRLYERQGWRPVASYGHYRDSPLSRCYGLDLA